MGVRDFKWRRLTRARGALFLGLAGLLGTGCGDSDPVSVGATQTEELAWIGTYTGAPGPGDIVLDLDKTGAAVTGEIVFGLAGTRLFVTGTMQSDSLFLALDTAQSSQPTDFSLRGRAPANGSLTATMTIPSSAFSADLSCDALPHRSIDDASRSVPYEVISLGYDGSHLWLGTINSDYVLMDPGGTIVDSVAIDHYPQATWTSDVLMYDGVRMWGVYPLTIIGPGGSTNAADLLGFNANGRTPDSLYIEHRPHGLAYDGAHYWSLRTEPTALIQFDGTGAVTDSVHLGIPDATQLVFDGAHFWTLGWYLRRLYEVDASGQVVAICNLPPASPGGLPTGLAVEGSYIWYAEGLIGTTKLHRMTIR